ncbi:MAG: YegP family protein [Bacteroidia bacterium]|jgi:hypothetical protein|nr:YegP family protein [Bacteroidia bacterium]
MAKFTIFKGSNQNYYFHLKADNGEKVLSSEGYSSKQGCQNGVASVRANAKDDSRYERKSTLAGYSFVLKAANGEIIGRSEVYSSAQARDNGIEVVKRIASGASEDDQT